MHCTETEQKCEIFTSDCFEEPLQFEKPIPRRKIKNFASSAGKSIVTKNLKLTELKCTRDLFGHLLYQNTVKNVDLEIVLFLLSYIHTYNTEKARLMHRIKGMVYSTCPSDMARVTVVDGMILLHTLQSLPPTFGEAAHIILRKLCDLGLECTDLVCDTCVTPSMKDVEHIRWNSEKAT